jgi:hypothetical protein
MDKKIRASHIYNIINSFFRSKDKYADYYAYKDNSIEEILSELKFNNFNTPEKAMAMGMYLCGRKAEFDSITEQARQAKAV